MKYQVTIHASFEHTVEVDAMDEKTAQAKASDELMDYLDLGLRKTKEFDYFHEYVLQEQVVGCIRIDNKAEQDLYPNA